MDCKNRKYGVKDKIIINKDLYPMDLAQIAYIITRLGERQLSVHCPGDVLILVA